MFQPKGALVYAGKMVFSLRDFPTSSFLTTVASKAFQRSVKPVLIFEHNSKDQYFQLLSHLWC
jgi:hypothetical protein